MTLRQKIASGLGRVLQFLDPSRLIIHKDRAGKQEIWRDYGDQRIAERDSIYNYDLFARDVNANVNIAIRAISDAVGSLPVQIVGIERTGNIDEEITDIDHEANNLIRHPNPEQTIREVIRHNVHSYLGDGNAYLTIEKQTGPNGMIEIWPRDPRTTDIVLSGLTVQGYRFGKGNQHTVFYKKNRVIHMRDIDVTEPLYGKPRHHAVRDEIMMDHVVNELNKGFFQNGAILNVMFTPEHDLSEPQHQMLMEAWKNEQPGGPKRWFKTFISRFAGKIETPDQKHKDIAFLELLKHNREKIFGAFGLPPFRGGVMEFSNYANALAQDRDFWRNTVMPITSVLEDAWNKQLVWPFFGDDVKLRFSFDDVEALKGDPKEQAEVHAIYFDMGVVTEEEVRADIGRPPLTDEQKATITKAKTPNPSDEDPDEDEDKGATPTEDEKDSVTLAIHRCLRQQKKDVLDAIKRFSVDGRLMSRFMDAKSEARTLFEREAANLGLHNAVLPLVSDALRARGITLEDTKDNIMRLAKITLNEVNDDTTAHLQSILHDCDKLRYTLPVLKRRLLSLFTRDRASKIAKIILTDTIKQIEATNGHKEKLDKLKRKLASKDKEAADA